MRQSVECVPNFSEGRRAEVVEAIAAAIRSVEGIRVLDVEMDPNHNRSVITFVGAPHRVEEAAFRAVARAAQLIDMTQHRGEHPRMGATDVLPFVPLVGVTMDDCVAMARRVGERIGRELEIPVYLYEEAATRESRRNLADVRRGEYEGIKAEIETDPDRAPDFGPARLGTAGATAVGARWPLIAYNVNLGTNDLSVARAIARAVRHSSGGLRYVKALGVALKDRGIVQVSMNLVRYQSTPIYRVFEMVKREAARYGVPVISSEVIGLIPLPALVDVADFYLQLERFSMAQVLETRLWEEPTEGVNPPQDFLDAVSAGTPTPGGGSVAALAGALAGSLAVMVTNLTLGQPRYAAVADAMTLLRQRAIALQSELTRLVREDSAAYQAVLAAQRMPRTSAEEVAAREDAIQSASRRAAEVPLQVAEQAVAVLALLPELVQKGNRNAISDAGVAAYLAHAAVAGAALNVRANLPGVKDASLAKEMVDRVERLVQQARERLATVELALGLPA